MEADRVEDILILNAVIPRSMIIAAIFPWARLQLSIYRLSNPRCLT